MKGKWPELVGQSAEAASQVIHNDRPELALNIVPAGAMVTMDHNVRRVRIYVNEQNMITSAPKVG